MNYIYHYCSLNTFMQIIENKTIRLSDLNKTNDYLEKKWGIDFLQTNLERVLKNHKISMDLEEDYWYSDEVPNHLEQLHQEVRSHLRYQTLIACFSLSKDLLSQWRAYGQDGAGVAVGFNYNRLKSLLSGQDDILIDRVIYDTNKQQRAIRERMLLPALEYMHELFQDYPIEVKDFNTFFTHEFDAFCEVLDKPVERTFTFLKNPAFREEKEVRIVYNTHICEEIDSDYLSEILNKSIEIGDKSELVLQPIRHQVKVDKMVAYADLCFENCVDSKIIKEVVIGPKSKVTEQDIRQILLANGFQDNVKISRSIASYQ